MAIQECAELRILADVRRACSVRHIFVEIDILGRWRKEYFGSYIDEG